MRVLSIIAGVRKWPIAEIEMFIKPVRVAPDCAEVFTSAIPPASDAMVRNGLT
jgi:hypothetical protein